MLVRKRFNIGRLRIGDEDRLGPSDARKTGQEAHRFQHGKESRGADRTFYRRNGSVSEFEMTGRDSSDGQSSSSPRNQIGWASAHRSHDQENRWAKARPMGSPGPTWGDAE